MQKNTTNTVNAALRTVGLFSGIGGLELGLSRHGHTATLLVENEKAAQSVLRSRFPLAKIAGDIRHQQSLPKCDLVAAGFPCQDLSQCGKTVGIDGSESSLVKEVFRLLGSAKSRPNWVLLENVPFMLQLDSGRAIRLVTSELVRLGYRWAYRTVNARAFGVPQRRLRVVIVASQTDDPRNVLFADDECERSEVVSPNAFGFYWTEGAKGLGWAPNSVPTLKGGSTIGIPSPPAIWIPEARQLATIDIRDAERLQGFPVNWTKTDVTGVRHGNARWRLVGNAVCVRVAAWVGRRLASPGVCRCVTGHQITENGRWPSAAYGDQDGSHAITASTWPVAWKDVAILDYLRFPLRPLSARATAGFLSRATKSTLKFDTRFLTDVAHHLSVARTSDSVVAG